MRPSRAARGLLPALLLAAALAVTPAMAQEAPKKSPEALATEGLDKLMRALDALIGMIPQYELPEMTEEGDIIIRRKRPESQPAPTPPEDKGDDAPTQT